MPPILASTFFSAESAQTMMGLTWLGMGAVTMLFPRPVTRLSLSKAVLPPGPEEAGGGAAQPALELAMRCFGAQACMCGVLLLTSKMDRRAHAIWGACIVPFFVFDYLAWRGGYLTPLGAIGDAAGNVVFLAASAVGAGWIKA
jgi:hypothetical protein